MRGLKFLYILFSVILFSVFHVLCINGKVPYAAINIFFSLMAPIGFIYAKPFSYILAGLSWLIFYPLFTMIYKIDPLNAVFPIFIFDCLLVGFAEYKKEKERATLEWSSKLKEREDIETRSLEEFKKLESKEDKIREKELAVVKLYEITKKLQETLKFDSIFDIFSTFLKENFTFRRSELIILKQIDTGLRVDRVYKVWGREDVEVHKLDLDYNKVVRLLSENKKEVYLTREADENIVKDLGVEDEVETFVSVPLLSERKLVGILTIENLPHTDLERFRILAMQFALEIKKVLLYETVEELAITDGLTRLYVRRHFIERLTEEVDRSKRYKFKFAFLMMDIDNFKTCNDTYGHLVGDVILKDVGRIIKENSREIDLATRYGGEEFSLVLPETGKEAAKIAGERIRRRIEENIFKAYDEKLKATISIGISVYPDDSLEINGLIEKADKALYAAKGAGKNIVLCV